MTLTLQTCIMVTYAHPKGLKVNICKYLYDEDDELKQMMAVENQSV